MSYKRFAGMFLLFSLSTFLSHAQPVLPDISAVTKDGINVLTWINPYTSGVTSVSIQRSADSTVNFGTIGLIKNTGNARQTFIDPHPLLGNNWYRVSVLFNSGTDWMSNTIKLTLDSSDILSQKTLLPDVTEEVVQQINKQDLSTTESKTTSSSSSETVTESVPPLPTYPKSQYVFTDPFSGNINIILPDAFEHHYSLHFYNQAGKEVLTVPRVNDTDVILDKRNFESLGLFQFKLYKGEEKFAEGYVTIY